MRFKEGFSGLRRKIEVFLGLALVLLVNILLGLNPDLAKLDWPLQAQAGLVLVDWVWLVLLLPKMEWQDWHDRWVLIWSVLAVLESAGLWWFFITVVGQTMEEAASTAVSVLILRALGVFLMRP